MTKSLQSNKENEIEKAIVAGLPLFHGDKLDANTLSLVIEVAKRRVLELITRDTADAYEQGWKDRDSDFQEVGATTSLEAYKKELKKRIGLLRVILPSPYSVGQIGDNEPFIQERINEATNKAYNDCLKLLEGGE